MNCAKCGKEIPDGENKICGECQKKLLEDIENDSGEDVKKEKKFDKKMIIYIGIFLVILAIVGVLYSFKDRLNEFIYRDNVVGNSVANIRNFGYVAEQGGWIYFVAPTEDAKHTAIYKSKEDGSEKTVLQSKDWEVVGLNVSGDYIYFIGMDSEEIETSTMLPVNDEEKDMINNKIYRMKLDGSELEVINSNEFHNNCYELYVIEDKIYYIGVDSNIYCMNLDGSEKTKLNDDETGFLGVTRDYIILNLKKDNSEETGNSFETFIMNRDCSDRKSLTGERLNDINVVEDYIYYTNSNKEIWKVKTDCTDNVCVNKDVKA